MAFALAGCSAAENGASSTADSAGSGPVPAAPQQGSGKSGAEKVTPPQAGATDRKLSRSARLELTATKVTDVVAQARGIAQGAGGYTGQESTGDESATLSLAVPADKLDGVLDQLSHLGTALVKRELNTQDVTEQVVDVEARLATQRASVERIRALLARATSVSEIASVESELTSREATLESLEQQRNSLAGSVAMATVAMTVRSVAAPPPPGEDHSGFFGGLAGGWHAFLVFGGGLLTVLGAIAPFLLFLAPLGWLAWWLHRRRRVVPAPEPGEG
ncbi:lipoprotein [Amycolatopsis vancoresmycina DSM 44592]|uniref:Lipoprotein n=1 Tax=Amycolatopsis vancoresmycina DSM 44592 TaxID=1292037 RepID=R1GDQ1_9PSEU|nr:lipoprotein [Amycolatopsis vancoresmycina DSM 44592]